MAAVHLLLLDDDPAFRETLAGALVAEGVQVLAAAPCVAQLPPAALARANAALVDVRMPREPGPEAVQRLRLQRPELVCVMLTSHDDASSIFASLRAGAVGYLLKSQAATAIAASLEEALAGGSPMSPGVARKVVRAFAEPAPSPGAALAELTPRERELLDHVARGLADKEVADVLGLSVWTVKNHLRHIYEKLHVRSRTEAIARTRGL